MQKQIIFVAFSLLSLCPTALSKRIKTAAKSHHEETKLAVEVEEEAGGTGWAGLAARCECSGMTTDEGGGPRCDSIDDGKAWCYVNEGLCPDAKRSNYGGHWSYKACTPPCQCSGRKTRTGGGPRCDSFDDGKPWCYVDQDLCPDAEPSNHGGQWSHKACRRCECSGRTTAEGGGPTCDSQDNGFAWCYVNEDHCDDAKRSNYGGQWSFSACQDKGGSSNADLHTSRCECSGRRTEEGGGARCDTYDEGKPWCYVDRDLCPDAKRSNYGGQWSHQACKSCECSGRTTEEGGGPNCDTFDSGKPWCYVDEGACGDGKRSNYGGHWSYSACQKNNATSR